MDTPLYWEESSNHVKFESAASSSTDGSTLPCKEEQSIYHYCEGNLNFATVATSEDDDYGFHKKKVSRDVRLEQLGSCKSQNSESKLNVYIKDPMSHRIIEKRRRDRMNNCLADLSRLIPAEYLKKGRGRIEKTEIIEMAIRHMKHLQAHACRHADQCELAQQQSGPEEAPEQPQGGGGGASAAAAAAGAASNGLGGPIVMEHYRLGYQECLSEAMHFMVEVEGFFAGEPLCVKLINHLQRHCERILKGDRLNFPRTHLGETTSSSGSSCGSGRGRGGGAGGGGGGGGGSSGLGSATASASGSGSSPGSCSDSGRADPRDSGVAMGPGGARRSAVLARHDDHPGCYEEQPGALGALAALGGAQDGNVPAPLGSQLRDMLTNAPSGVGPLAAHPASALHAGAAPPPAHGAPAPSQPPPARPYAPASPGFGPAHAADAAHGALYKFKNNIKQRFSAEHHHGGPGAPGARPTAGYAPKRRRYASEADEGPGGAGGGSLLSLSMHRRDSETCSVPSPPASPPLHGAPPRSPPPPPSPSDSPPPPAKFAPAPPPGAAAPPPPARPVPIFALHSRGAYYVPLTLDSDALAPYMAECGACACGCEGPQEQHAAPVALHPVTISVNFSRAPAPAPAPCPRLSGAPAPAPAPAPPPLPAPAPPPALLPWKAEPAPWKAEPGVVFAGARWAECLPDRA